MIDDTYIEKLNKFISTEEIKTDFRLSMIFAIKEEMDKLSVLEKSQYFDYIKNITENIYTIEEIYLCCHEEVKNITYSYNLGCIKHMLLLEKANNIKTLIEKTEICYDILYKCLSEMI